MRRHRIRELGTTPEVIEDMLSLQEGGCAICGGQPGIQSGRVTNFHIDHCHSSGRVRGLLCGPCNVGIGMLKDSPQILLKAVSYLLKSLHL